MLLVFPSLISEEDYCDVGDASEASQQLQSHSPLSGMIYAPVRACARGSSAAGQPGSCCS